MAPNIEIDPLTGAPIVRNPDAKGPIVMIPPAAVSSTPPVTSSETTEVTEAKSEETTSKIKTRKEEVLEEMNAIIKKHGGNLGDIPINDHYWDLLKEYRIL